MEEPLMKFALLIMASDGRPSFVMPNGERLTIEPNNGLKFTDWAFCYRSESEAHKAHDVVMALHETTPSDFKWPSLEYAKEVKERLSNAFIVRSLDRGA